MRAGLRGLVSATVLVGACSELDRLTSEKPPPSSPASDAATPSPVTTPGPTPAPAPSPNPSSTPGPTPPDPALPDNEYCRPVRESAPELAAFEAEIVALANALRAKGASCGGRPHAPVPPLVMDPALRCAARAHAQDMIDRRFFDHTNPSGEGVVERVAKAGFRARNWGENIAAGGATASATFQQWLGSAGHCSNIMSPSYRHLGVGYRRGGNLRHYWTQVFAVPR